MSFIYPKIEFLELFNEEQVIDAEAKITRYTLNFNDEFKFTCSLYPYDGDVIISLWKKDWTFPVCDIALREIEDIKIDTGKPGETRLNFYKQSIKDPIFILMIKPNFSIQTEV